MVGSGTVSSPVPPHTVSSANRPNWNTKGKHPEALGRPAVMADDGYAAFMAFMGTDSKQEDKDASASAPAKTAQRNEDEYHYEEEQEREAMMKNYHYPMKQWFRQNPTLTVRQHTRCCRLFGHIAACRLSYALCAICTNGYVFVRCWVAMYQIFRANTDNSHCFGKISRPGRLIVKY